MDQNFGTPIPPIEEPFAQPAKKKNTTLIVVIALVVLLCCCCILVTLLSGVWFWNNGDQLIEDLSLTLVIPALVSLA